LRLERTARTECLYQSRHEPHRAAQLAGLIMRNSEILTKKETAERLRISERNLDRLCATDSGLRKIQLSPRRVGFLDRDVAALIERLANAV
jgi:predicted DNA-binding transcriptional regulator AlpA